ncbi:MAG: hypothetical protein ABDH21_04190 [bacterium]
MSFWLYFPLNIKNTWIYKTSEKFSNDYLITKVVITEKIPFSDKAIYIFSYYVEDEEIKKESYIIQKDGIFLYAKKIEDNLVVYDPIVPFLPFNFESIDWWSWEGKAGFVPSKILFKNTKTQEKETSKIVYIEENKFGKSEYIIVLKKNIGIVREEAETPFIGYTSELEDYDVSFDDFSYINFEVQKEESLEEFMPQNIKKTETYRETVIMDLDDQDLELEQLSLDQPSEENIPEENIDETNTTEYLNLEDDIFREEDENENRW